MMRYPILLIVILIFVIYQRILEFINLSIVQKVQLLLDSAKFALSVFVIAALIVQSDITQGLDEKLIILLNVVLISLSVIEMGQIIINNIYKNMLLLFMFVVLFYILFYQIFSFMVLKI